jgi:Leucine-rich repeat (LRR) protein
LSRNFLQNRYNVGPDDLSGLSGLGPDDLYKLSVASLVSRRDVGERVLEALSHLSGLQILCLSGTGVTDEQMEYLKALRSLKALELHQEYSVSDPGLAVLKKLPALEYLDLETRATDAGFKHLAQLQNLRYLKIQTGMIWGPGLAELAKLPCLERLCLWGQTGLSNRHIRNLEGLTRLKSLTLWGTGYRLTDADLVSIGKLTGLEELYFIKIATNFTNSGMTHLKSLKNLRKVDFASSQIGDTRIRHLAALPNLEAIEGGLLLNSESTKTLASFQNLKSLHVGLEVPQSQSAPTDMANIAGLKNLEELIIDGRQLSDEDLTCIESLSCLRKLSFIGKDVTDRTMASISKLKQLEYFKLYLSSLTKSGLNQLGGLTNLRVLDVSVHPNSRCSADEVRLDLSGLTNLNTLELSGFSLQDADLRSLTGLDHLEWLKLQNESLSEEALRHLKNLSGLRRLYINEVSCSTGSGLVHLAGLTKLTDLTLQGRIRDAALDRLTGLAALRNLRIVTDEPIRTQTISNLRQRLPAIAYINIEKLTQISRPANRENQARKRVNPPRVNQQRSRARRRRR